MCYRTAKNKKLPFIAVLTSFLILGKIQDDGQDGNHCWWRHRPPAAPPPIKIIYLILLRTSKAFHWRQNRFEILQHMKNPGEGFHQPPPPSCTTVGVWICVYVRGLSCPFLIATILVTNRWNRHRFSWISWKIPEIYSSHFSSQWNMPSPSPMLSHACFEALRPL